MPMTALYLRHRRPVDFGVTPGTTTISRRARELFRRAVNLTEQLAVNAQGDSEFTLVYGGSVEPAFANSGLAIATGSGAVGATINGVAVTATWATSDTIACALVANAINTSTNALVQGMVTATNLTATLTLTSVAAGDTVEICGTKFIAYNGTKPLTVSAANQGYFDMSGADAADATALATAINTYPGLDRYVYAVPVSNVVRLFAKQGTYNSGTSAFAWPTGPGVPTNYIVSTASTIVASGSALVAGAFVGIVCPVPGVLGNAVTVAASGTGVTTLNSETRLNRGQALNVVGITEKAA